MWMKVRIILILSNVIVGALTSCVRVGVPPLAEMPLVVRVFLYVGGSLGILMIVPTLLGVVGLQAINPWSAKVWHKPDWRESFLTFRDPIRFFHFCAFYVLAAGCGRFLAALVGRGRFDILGTGWLCGGAAILLGVRLCMRLYRWKYANNCSQNGKTSAVYSATN